MLDISVNKDGKICGISIEKNGGKIQVKYTISGRFYYIKIPEHRNNIPRIHKISCGHESLIWAVDIDMNLWKIEFTRNNQWTQVAGSYLSVAANYIGDVWAIDRNNKIKLIESHRDKTYKSKAVSKGQFKGIAFQTSDAGSYALKKQSKSNLNSTALIGFEIMESAKDGVGSVKA